MTRLWTFGALVSAALPDPDWLLPGLLTGSGWTLLVGQEKAGKTILALQLADALTRGSAFLGTTPTQPLKVLMVEADAPLGTVQHQLKTLGSPLSDALNPTLILDMPQGFLFRSEERFVRDALAAVNPDLLIWDALEKLAWAELADVNSPAGAQRIIRRLKEMHPRFVLIHHERKMPPGETGYEDSRRASSGTHWLTADASTIWGLRADRLTGTLTLYGRLVKPDRALIRLKRNPVTGAWVEAALTSAIRASLPST